jgi:4'-phosphopantetheinyl transferase
VKYMGPVSQSRLSLPPNEVHVWRARLTQPPRALARLARVLSSDERDRAARFRTSGLRASFVACRAVQRHVLSRYLPDGPHELVFDYSMYGKPSIAGETGTAGISFNTSNSGDVAVIAVCHGQTVGVDIEKIRPVSNADCIAGRFFAPEDVAQFRAGPSVERARVFLELWTRREACIKAVGATVWSELGQADLIELWKKASHNAAAGAANSNEQVHLHMGKLALDSGFVGTLAVLSSERPLLRNFEWTRRDLI